VNEISMSAEGQNALGIPKRNRNWNWNRNCIDWLADVANEFSSLSTQLNANWNFSSLPLFGGLRIEINDWES